MLMIVGEAWGREEAEAGKPFVGASGRLLFGMLSQVGISRSDCYVTNVFNFQPQPTNDIKNLCGPKALGIPKMPAIAKSQYIDAKYEPELKRLYKEITDCKPNLILCLGSTAAWAILQTTGIKKIRGAATWSNFVDCKVLVTYHPAAVLREWSLRTVLLADLKKAARECRVPTLSRPSRKIWTQPTLSDLYLFEKQFIEPSPDLSIDIETTGNQITCIGFAPSIHEAIVVPFTSAASLSNNYWPTFREELKAWAWVKKQCGREKAIVGQNFLYDIHFLWRQYGITIPNATDDTMLMHHALHPELEKGLGFLGSIYTDEAAWKFMRTKHDTIKRED